MKLAVIVSELNIDLRILIFANFMKPTASRIIQPFHFDHI